MAEDFSKFKSMVENSETDLPPKSTTSYYDLLIQSKILEDAKHEIECDDETTYLFTDEKERSRCIGDLKSRINSATSRILIATYTMDEEILGTLFGRADKELGSRGLDLKILKMCPKVFDKSGKDVDITKHSFSLEGKFTTRAESLGFKCQFFVSEPNVFHVKYI